MSKSNPNKKSQAQKFKLKMITSNIIFRIVAMLVISLGVSRLISGLTCNFIFNDVLCPSGGDSVWIGGLIGAISTGLFFFFIDFDAKLIVKKFDRIPISKRNILQVVGIVIIFITSITILGIFTEIGYCNLFGDEECPIQEAQIFLGSLIGGITSAVFFILIGKSTTSALEKLGRVYIVRTCMLNLMDIFGKENGKGRILKTENNRRYFLDILKDDYLDVFKPKESIVDKILEMAIKHGEISEDHDHEKCERDPSCKLIFEEIKKFNDMCEFKNPIELDIRLDKINNWMK